MSSSTPVQPSLTTIDAREWLLVLAAAILLKLLCWQIDPTMRTFVGDSATYLWAALSNQPPPDRSFTYPLIIRATALAQGNLALLGCLQSAIGVLLCTLVYRCLRRDISASRSVATVLALLLAIEPGQLFYERMVMTETFGTFCFAVMVLSGLRYLRSDQTRWLVLMAVSGTLVASMRLSLLPVVLGFAPLPVLARLFGDRPGWLRWVAHLILAVAATLMLHSLYKHWYDRKSDALQRSDYTHSSGRMRLGLLAPLVKPEHLQRAGLPGDLVAQTRPSSSDPQAREAQIWSETGLYSLIAQHSAHPEDSARKVAMYAFRDDPFGLVRLGIGNLFDYFNAGITRSRMDDDLGQRPPDAGMLQIIAERYGYDARGVATRTSPVYRYYAASRIWWIILLFALPLLAIVVLVRGRRRDPAAATLLSLLALGMFVSQVLFSHIVSFRYLHPFAVVAAVLVAYLLSLPTGSARR